jgi:hypothetical protein
MLMMSRPCRVGSLQGHLFFKQLSFTLHLLQAPLWFLNLPVQPKLFRHNSIKIPALNQLPENPAGLIRYGMYPGCIIELKN